MNRKMLGLLFMLLKSPRPVCKPIVIMLAFITLILAAACTTAPADPEHPQVAPSHIEHKSPLEIQLDGVLNDNSVSNERSNVQLITAAIKQFGTSDPAACKAFYQLGCNQYDLRNYSDAIVALTASLGLKESVFGLHLAADIMMSQCYAGAHNYDDAIKYCKLAISQPAPDTDRATYVPLAYVKAAEYEEMLPISESKKEKVRAKILAAYVATTTHEPASWQTYVELASRYEAEAYRDAGDLKMANTAFNRFLASHPKSTDAAFMALEQAQMKMGKRDVPDINVLLGICQRYDTNTPSGITVLYNLAMGYSESKQHDNAIAAFKKVSDYADAHPDQPPVISSIVPLAYGNAMVEYIEERKTDEAVKQAHLLLAKTSNGTLSEQAQQLIASYNLEHSKKRQATHVRWGAVMAMLALVVLAVGIRYRRRFLSI